MKVSWKVRSFRSFLPLGTSLTFLFLFFSLGDASWTWISAWTMKVSWELGVFAIGNVINVPFSFFFFRGRFLDLDFGLGYEGKLGWCFCYHWERHSRSFTFFSLGAASWTWISAWTMKVSWELGVFAIGNVINVPFSFFFFRGRFLDLDFGLVSWDGVFFCHWERH